MTRHIVDVVIADPGPDTEAPAVGVVQAPERVDVAPDPRGRIILVAPTKRRGEHEARGLGIEPVAIVTPRTPDAARGYTADDIVWSDDLTAEDREALTPHVAPAITAQP